MQLGHRDLNDPLNSLIYTIFDVQARAENDRLIRSRRGRQLLKNGSLDRISTSYKSDPDYARTRFYLRLIYLSQVLKTDIFFHYNSYLGDIHLSQCLKNNWRLETS